MSANLKTKFISLTVLVVVFFVVDIIANMLYLYWTYSWFDAAMHFFGGLLVGTFFILVLRMISPGIPSRTKVLSTALISAVAVGALWEINEYAFGITGWSSVFVSDTVSDMSMDIVGGLTAYLWWVYANYKLLFDHGK